MSRYIHNNPDFDAMFIRLYPHTPNKEFTVLTGLNASSIKYHSKRLGVKKTRAAKALAVGCTDWNQERKQFIRDNFFEMSNQQLADALGVTLTVLRNQTKVMGLKHYSLEYWTPAQTEFLKTNYETYGDVEIAEILQARWPREKQWTRKHVHKKRSLLKLDRSDEALKRIVRAHSQPGGRSDTIRQNSASVTMADRWVANCITRDSTLKAELLNHPELIKLKRTQLQLTKTIKEVKNA